MRDEDIPLEGVPLRRRLVLSCGCVAFCSLPVAARAQAREQKQDSKQTDSSAFLSELLREKRSLWLSRGSERLFATYWTATEGYNRDEYLRICWLLRDVQADRVFSMQHGLLDVLAGIQAWIHKQGMDEPLVIHSGYRTLQTNRRTEAAASNSRHITGQAADISVAGLSNLQLAGIASALGTGGTGLYVGKNFVHVDTGNERIWINRPERPRRPPG